jgi:2-amino-4-hydroxy-6-hydroxymethyldihydropteridine diphosphokinase
VSGVDRELCFIGLGSNLGSSLGDPTETLSSAISAIKAISSVQQFVLSSYYQSKPHGPQDQPDYINAVAGFTARLEPIELLDQMQAIENSHGRVRSGAQWSARTLDLDILLYGDHQINEDRLVVPHPWMTRREFVLYPLHEIAEGLTLPDGSLLESYLDQVSDDTLIKIKPSM